MSNQVISRRSFTTSFTFTDTPSKETRTALIEAGYQYDGKSGQWFRSQKEASVVGEEVIAKQLAA